MKKGFTLLEILIVIVIIAILATFAIPQYIRASKRAIASEAVSIIGSIKGAMARYYQEFGALPGSFSSGGTWPLDIDDPESVAGGANFSYTVSVTDSSTQSGYTIRADGKGGRRATGLEVRFNAGSNKYGIYYNGTLIAGEEVSI